ncbi:hypothetical protein AB6D11_00985 [Vibrio splendidus]
MTLISGYSTLGFAHVYQCTQFHFDLAQHWPLKLSKLKELSAQALGFTTYNGLIAAIKHQPVWFDANMWHQSLMELAHSKHGLDKSRLSEASELFAEQHLSDFESCYFSANSVHYLQFTMQISGLSGLADEEDLDEVCLTFGLKDELEETGLSVVNYLQRHFPNIAKKICNESEPSLNYSHQLGDVDSPYWQLPTDAFDNKNHVIIFGSYAPYAAQEGVALSGLTHVLVKLASPLNDDEISALKSHPLSSSGEHISATEPHLEAIRFGAKGLVLDMVPISIMHDELLVDPKPTDHFVHPYTFIDTGFYEENQSRLDVSHWATRFVTPQLLRPYLLDGEINTEVVTFALDSFYEMIHSSISWDKGCMEVTRPRLPDLVRTFGADWGSEPFDDLLAACYSIQDQLVVEPEITLNLPGESYPSFALLPTVRLIVHSAHESPTTPLNASTLGAWLSSNQVTQLNYVDLLQHNDGNMVDNLFVGSDEQGHEQVRFEIMSLFGYDPSWHEALTILKSALPKGVYHNDSLEFQWAMQFNETKSKHNTEIYSLTPPKPLGFADVVRFSVMYLRGSIGQVGPAEEVTQWLLKHYPELNNFHCRAVAAVPVPLSAEQAYPAVYDALREQQSKTLNKLDLQALADSLDASAMNKECGVAVLVLFEGTDETLLSAFRGTYAAMAGQQMQCNFGLEELNHLLTLPTGIVSGFVYHDSYGMKHIIDGTAHSFDALKAWSDTANGHA